MTRFPFVKVKEDVPDLFFRPPLQLQALSFPLRWEVTRRHPSYLTYWKRADVKTLFKDVSDIDELQKYMDQMRVVMLGGIGVPPEGLADPATEFSQMGELNPAWVSGAVHPVSIRGLANLLLAVLPSETVAGLGEIFIEASKKNEPNALPQRILAAEKLASMHSEGLDYLTPQPFISITPSASGRQVGREVQNLLKQWKQELGLSETRNRTGKTEVYLDVWDRREGWVDGKYDAGSGKPFHAIAKELKRSLSTIHSQYKSAFKQITGYTYSFHNFCELFGLLLFSRLASDGGNFNYRRMAEATSSPVPESQLGISLNTFTGNLVDLSKENGPSLNEFWTDYTALSKEGLTNEQIALKLEVVDFKAFMSLIELYKMP